MPLGNWRRALEDPERSAFVLGGKILFIALFLVVASIAVTASYALLVVAMFVTAGIMVRTVVPTDSVGEWFEALWNGEVGERWYDRYCTVKGWAVAAVRWPFEQLWRLGSWLRSATGV